MKKSLVKLLAVMLCLCSALVFAACGEEEPNNIDPPIDNTDQPSADTPTEPEQPTEPQQPVEPEKPVEPDEPSEPDVPTEPETPTEPEITWDADAYQNIVDNYENKAIAVYENKVMVATKDKVQLFYVEYENTTPVMKKYKEFDFSVQKLLVNEYAFGFITTDGDLYQYVNFADGHENGQPTKIMENVKNAVFGIASGMAVKNDGTLWEWENDRIIGTQIFYSLGEPILRATGILDFDMRVPVRVCYYDVNNNYGPLEDGKVDPDDTNIKKNIDDFFKVHTDNSLLFDDTKVLDYVGQSSLFLTDSYYDKYVAYLTDISGNLLRVERAYKNGERYAKITDIAESCLYIAQYDVEEEHPLYFIDTEYNLWMVSTAGEKKLVDTNVAYVPQITSHLWYVKMDNTIWVDGKYAMDMENTIPISPDAAEEPEITVAPKPPKASYADDAAKAIADVALGRAKFFDTTTKTIITVDEYGKQEGELEKFHVMDIDQDGAKELILRPYSLPADKNILVLHYDGKQVNGYRVLSRNWRTMRHNGIAESIDEHYDADALVKARFENYEMIIERVAEKKFDEQWNLYRYYVNGEETAKENYVLQYKIWEAQGYISFYDISEEDIEKEVLTEKKPAEPVVISPEAAKAAIRDVLLGKTQFFDTYDKRYTTLPEERVRREAVLNEGEDRPDRYRTYSYNRFALVDLDGDGALECIIESSMYHIEGYKVLHFGGEKVNMYSTTYRGWDGIKVDGTAYGSGVVVTYFKNGQMLTRSLCSYVKDYPFIFFYVNDYPADRHEYNRVEEDYSAQEDVTWYQFNETEIMKMLGDFAEPDTPAQPEVPAIPTSPSDI